MPRRDSRASGGFLAVPCPYCDPALGARLLLIDRIGNPESFWLPQSYWRHLQKFHSPSCERVVAALQKYLGLQLNPDTEERMLLHLTECKVCHVALLGMMNECKVESPGLMFPEG